MGVLQNQFNSALTGLTFLAQQTPQWQRGRDIMNARTDLSNANKLITDANKKKMESIEFYAKNDLSVPSDVIERHDSTIKSYTEDRNNLIRDNRRYLPDEYARLVGETNPTRPAQESAQAMTTAQESAQARQQEIATADNNMKSYVDYIREMREKGIIKSNKQMKSMIYKAEHQEDKK